MKLRPAILLMTLLGLPLTASAQSVPADAGKNLTLTFGSGVVSTRSKVDRLLPAENTQVFVVGTDLTGKNSKLSLTGRLAEPGLTASKSIVFNGRTGGLGVFGLKIGFGFEYFYSKEVEPLIRELNFSVDDETKKHYLLVGPDILYGNMKGSYVRGAYMVGAADMRIDGQFHFDSPDNDVRLMSVLYDLDTQPAHMFLVDGAYANLWRLRLAGSVRVIRTLEAAKFSNTKHFIPLQHVVTEASVQTHVWRFLSVSASGTFTDNDRGRIFIGDSIAVLTVVKF